MAIDKIRLKNMTPKELFEISKEIGMVYKQCKIRKEYVERFNCIGKNKEKYEEDCSFVTIILYSLEKCAKRNKLIIENEVLNEPERDWYLDYFSRSSYYRYRLEAFREFIGHVMSQDLY